MIFCGNTFCGGKYTADTTPTYMDGINSVTLQNGVFDKVFVSKAVYVSWNGHVDYVWNYDTLMFADFEENLLGGNVDFTSETVDSIRIKRRKKGDYKFQTIGEVPITSNEDLKFQRFDYLANANQEWEYALVPCVNGVEGNLNINSIFSEFEGLFLVEKDIAINAVLNYNLTHKRNRDSSSVVTFGRKYPFHVSNGEANYTSGTVEATFIEKKHDCTGYDVEDGWKYRENVNDFLTNGKPKILKNFEGKMWLVYIVESSIDENHSSHYQNVIHSFDWEECGDAYSVHDLYGAGLLDVDVDGD